MYQPTIDMLQAEMDARQKLVFDHIASLYQEQQKISHLFDQITSLKLQQKYLDEQEAKLPKKKAR